MGPFLKLFKPPTLVSSARIETGLRPKTKPRKISEMFASQRC